MIRHFVNFLLLILPPSRLFKVRFLLLKLAGINLEFTAQVCGGGWIYGRGPLVIGDRTWLSPSIIFYTHLDAPIKIGDNCDIGPEVKFITGSHEVGPQSRRAGKGAAKSIVVGDGCWIGAGSLILGGVTIGKGSIVAAGSVVTKDVEENSLVAGVPAVLKKELI